MALREIIFRGKRLDNGEWVEGYYVYLGPVTLERAYIIPFYASALYTYEVDPSTVGQFTGLLDKNGKRIFEGDIVRLYFIDAEEVGEIVWDEERCRVAYFSPDGDIYGVDGTVEIEIIGNIHDGGFGDFIHDNPELLKEDNDE